MQDRQVDAVAFYGVLNHLIGVADGARLWNWRAPFRSQDVHDTLGCGLHKPRLGDVRPNPDAGRSKCVWIIEKGRALRDKTIAGMSPECKTMAKRFDMARLAEIQPVLSRMRILLDNHRNAEPPCDRPVER